MGDYYMLTMEDVFRRTIVSYLRYSDAENQTFSTDCFCGHDPVKLEEAGIITRSHYHDQHMCPHCYAIGKPVRARKTESGKTHYYVHCRRCGDTRIKKSSLLQWRLSWEAVVRLFMKGMGIREEWTPLIPDRLIKLGQRKNRDYFLVRKLEVGNLKGYTQILLNYPNAVLVVHDQEAPHRLAATMLSNPVITLYDLLKITETDEIDFDYETAQEIIGPDPVPLVETRPEYGFKDIGDFWEITFAGKTKAFAKKRGFDYIRYLIEHQEESFFLLDLKCFVDHVRPEDLGPINDDGESADKDTIRAVKKKKKELQSQLENARAEGDKDEIADISKLIVQCNSYLKKVSGLKCEVRVENERLEKIRKAVSNAIARTLDIIRADIPDCANYLKNAITKDNKTISYSPLKPVDWNL